MRINSKPISSSVILLLVSSVVFLPLIWQIGYLNDDWYLMYSAGAYGPKVFANIFSVDRPARALVMIPAYLLFGGNPLYYNLSAYIFRLLSAVAFFWLLKMLWPNQPRFVLLASLLYLIYPGFLSQNNGIDYQSQMVSLAAAMFSIALSVKAALIKRFWLKTILMVFSIFLGWLYLGLVEYFIGFEIFRVLCLFLLAFREVGSWKNKMLEGVKLWAPNIFTPLLFLVWRVFFFQGERGATDVNIQFEQVKQYPMQTLYHWAVQVLQDFFDVTIAAWVVPLSQLARYIQFWGVLLSVIVVGLVLYVLSSSSNDVEQEMSVNFTREALIFGLIVAIGGLIPIAMVNREVAFPWFSRYSLVSSAGVAIMLSAMLMSLKHRLVRYGLISMLILISVLTHHANTVKAVQHTALTRDFWWQVSWRAPQIEKNTTLIASYPDVSLEEDYFVWGPANLIYYPEKQNEKDIQPGLFAAILSQNTVEKVMAREPQVYDNRKNIITYANYRNILVLTQPAKNSCVHVVDGIKPEYSHSERDLIREIGQYSEMMRVFTDETPHTPPTVVFGTEPDHGWCYYYQKADLARQRGEWNKVLEIGEQAFGQGFEPRDLIEWMPFLQAYAVAGDVDRLVELASAINADPYISQQVCQILGGMSELSSPVKDVVNTHYCVE